MRSQAPLQAVCTNKLLAGLPTADYLRLTAHMQLVVLPAKKVLWHARSAITDVYFPLHGVISAMTVMENGNAIEVATIGNEGMAGITAFVGGDISPNDFMVQVEGAALRLRASILEKESERNSPLRNILNRYHSAFLVQISYSVACNGLHTVEKRCCRWLLMTQDRVGLATLPLTHEFLSVMLGVHRSSITEILGPLQERGLIRTGRGKITILDRPGLEARSCECYHAVKAEFTSVSRN